MIDPAYPHGPAPDTIPGDEYEQGVGAHDKQPLDANPYSPGSPEHYAWWVGWHDAAEDSELDLDEDEDEGDEDA